LKANNTLIFSLFGSDHIVNEFARKLGHEKGRLTQRQFPDGESYQRYETPVKGKKIIIVDTLNHPNEKILPLIFAAETAKELGAAEIGFVAPYLAYMRQDTRFHSGEAITSRYFAKLISQAFDWMITVDPHLHRYHTLSKIYTIPTEVVSAAPVISSWIHNHIKQPILIGPDGESKQWVSQISEAINAPFTILEKVRLGDHDVKVSIPTMENFPDHVPVLVDDIVSTGQTMIETIRHLKSLKTKQPVCIAVHPIFSGITTQTFIEAGAQKVVSCNTIPHDSNQLDLSKSLMYALKDFIKR
jgi:ribose-phosphate pyrophosphokinase